MKELSTMVGHGDTGQEVRLWIEPHECVKQESKISDEELDRMYNDPKLREWPELLKYKLERPDKIAYPIFKQDSVESEAHSIYEKHMPDLMTWVQHKTRCENVDGYYAIFGNPPPGAIGTREFYDMIMWWKRGAGYYVAE
jgi:hypothetical protein